MGCTETGEFNDRTNTNIFSVNMTWDHWAAASARLKQSLLIPLNETAGVTDLNIERIGHKTIIRMNSSGSLAETNPNFGEVEKCLEWVQAHKVGH